MKVEKPSRGISHGVALVREDYAELTRIWPGTVNRNLTSDLVELGYTTVYLAVSLPFYLIASIALALALYVRCASTLLLAE